MDAVSSSFGDDRVVVGTPIGVVRSARVEPFDDDWGDVPAVVELPVGVLPAPADAVRGLDAFSHLEVVFLFHLVDPRHAVPGARRPRGNPAWPQVGILAQRAKGRPNRLGVSRCRLREVELQEASGAALLHVQGLDAIDGTPVLDVKPWMSGFAPRGPVAEPEWAVELMRDYW